MVVEIQKIEKETNDTAHEIAKYQKIIYNKMMEYGLKKYNKEQKASVSALPSSKRWQFADVKEEFTVSTLKEYNEITDGLADETRGSLKDQMDVASAQAQINAILAADPGKKNNNVTYIADKTSSIREISVHENIKIWKKIFLSQINYNQIKDILSVLNLENFLNTRVSTLSLGEIKKLELLRLIIENKKIWILDEPLTNLDEHSINVIGQTFTDHCKNDGCIIFSSHQDLNILVTEEINL